MADCVNALKEWTGKSNVTVIYDSMVDEFTGDGLLGNVIGKSNVAIVATTTDGDVFGGFYSVAVTKQKTFFNDPNMFVFWFDSHGRCERPQPFDDIEQQERSNLVDFHRDRSCEVQFTMYRCCELILGNEKSDSCYVNLSEGFSGSGTRRSQGSQRAVRTRPSTAPALLRSSFSN